MEKGIVFGLKRVIVGSFDCEKIMSRLTDWLSSGEPKAKRPLEPVLGHLLIDRHVSHFSPTMVQEYCHAENHTPIEHELEYRYNDCRHSAAGTRRRLAIFQQILSGEYKPDYYRYSEEYIQQLYASQ
jgi:hypothetical protein